VSDALFVRYQTFRHPKEFVGVSANREHYYVRPAAANDATGRSPRSTETNGTPSFHRTSPTGRDVPGVTTTTTTTTTR